MALYPVVRKLLQKRVVLASASPRRQEILSNAGLRFEVVPSRFKEQLNKASFPTPYAYAMETAKQKALDVARRVHQKDLRAPDIVIGADTIVAVGGLILEKPMDKQDAYSMLSRLNGKEHSVFTGVAIIHCSYQDGRLDMEVSEFYEETLVKFSQLSEELLWEYIHSGEPMDKAGGYGIQALGGMLVEYVRGDFLNVVGFPLNHFCKKLAELYFPPRPENVQRVKHDSIPPVDTFEGLSDLSDVEGGGSSPAHSQQGHGTKDTHAKGTVAGLHSSALLEVIDGFKASKALFTASKMKVFDALGDGAPLSAVDVARKIDASEHGTGRLLDACAALGLLEKTHRGYRNTELASRYLRSDGEFSLHSLILHSDTHVWNLFTHLESAVREGTHQHPRALGSTADDPSQGTCRSQDQKLRCLGAMHGLSKLSAHQVATAFDLSQFTSACDLGGCTGALAHELAREYPGLKVTVFDLPEVIEDVKRFQPNGPQTEQVTFVPGDFFKDRLPEADLYILSRILHDWSDEKVHELLSRVSGSCKPGGCLLVAESTLDEEKQAARPGLLPSLDLLVQAQGRARSLSEYRHLLQAHGFTDVRAAGTGNIVDVILATRTEP
ncbi:probable bifunctional dTTP/UTP pyrophosphatase/methyltransferase protein [Molossus molossus]|uniref:Acetylserotonin O-methyltransferase like n=1 Tax=Molossus molossus TaxID=27622 RepID=A0A7J8J5P0_MOLMO|nr:probable bifunctional dTTP/UTP pyrophosphatase/methyltransferase protein [Molossus molossus]KAF6491760.1 acetylserotonin O-methyltransferase like [Molossus molossus]